MAFSSGKGAQRSCSGSVSSDDDSAQQANAGPGWYDSSWDLRCGLLVREGPADANLAQWLEHHLRAALAASR